MEEHADAVERQNSYDDDDAGGALNEVFGQHVEAVVDVVDGDDSCNPRDSLGNIH